MKAQKSGLISNVLINNTLYIICVLLIAPVTLGCATTDKGSMHVKVNINASLHNANDLNSTSVSVNISN
jgi:hypothetical protein